jgi:hypothetical protein
MPPIKIETGSVKVMRSHDYCHFEVCLSSSEANTPELVDELRKTAARLADKAVAQYATAKADASNRLSRKYECESAARDAEQIEAKPEGDRTVNEMARLKAFKDKNWDDYISSRYDYQDNWGEENT